MRELLLSSFAAHDLKEKDHVTDHLQMMEKLRELAAAHASGAPMRAGGAEEALDFLGRHIATRDRLLAEYLAGEQ